MGGNLESIQGIMEMTNAKPFLFVFGFKASFPEAGNVQASVAVDVTESHALSLHDKKKHVDFFANERNKTEAYWNEQIRHTGCPRMIRYYLEQRNDALRTIAPKHEKFSKAYAEELIEVCRDGTCYAIAAQTKAVAPSILGIEIPFAAKKEVVIAPPPEVGSVLRKSEVPLVIKAGPAAPMLEKVNA